MEHLSLVLGFPQHRCVSVSALLRSTLLPLQLTIHLRRYVSLSPVRRLLLLSLLGLSCPGARRALHLFASAAVTTTDWAAWNNRNVLACRLDTRRLTWVSLSYITNWQDAFLSGSSFSNVQRPPVFLGSRLSLSTFKASIGGSAPSHIASFHLFVQSHRSLPLSLTLLLPPPSF